MPLMLSMVFDVAAAQFLNSDKIDEARLRPPSLHKVLPQKLVKTWGPKPGLKYVHTAVGNCAGSVVANSIRVEVGSPFEVEICGGFVVTNGIKADVGSHFEGVLLPQKLVKTRRPKLGLKYVYTAIENYGGSVVTNGIGAEVGSHLEGVKLVKTWGPKPRLKYVHRAVGNSGGSVVTNGIRAEKLVKTRGPKPRLKYVHRAVGNSGGSVVTNGIRAEVDSPLEAVVG
nr:hypothetical protein CFP56_73086 [Quercus suber]